MQFFAEYKGCRCIVSDGYYRELRSVLTKYNQCSENKYRDNENKSISDDLDARCELTNETMLSYTYNCVTLSLLSDGV